MSTNHQPQYIGAEPLFEGQKKSDKEAAARTVMAGQEFFARFEKEVGAMEAVGFEPFDETDYLQAAKRAAGIV